MRFPILSAAFAAVCLALPTTAQDNGTKQDHGGKGDIQVFGGMADRKSSTVFLFGDKMMAGMTLTYGQPQWQEEYTGMLDKLKGKLNRLGKDMWTTFMTTVPVEIGGVKVAAGSYVVALHCDADGKLALAFLDTTKAMKEGALPFGPQKWTPDAVCPLTLNKDAAKESMQKMSMELKANAEEPTKGTFTLAWGKHTATAPVMMHVGK